MTPPSDTATLDKRADAIAGPLPKMARSSGAERLAPEADHAATHLHRVVVVGGGAGGLELVTRLGEKLGRKRKARVMLVDHARRHVWKPMLHAVAAGSIDPASEALDYMAQAHWHAFHFRLGEMVGLDREKRIVHVAPYVDDDGMQLTPARSFPYDTLVLAIGSHSNDFGTPGVKEYARRLETVRDADRFHRLLVNACIRANAQPEPLREEQLDIAIIGAGATGVELAAELHNMMRKFIDYGLDRIDAERDVHIHLIEAAPRILPGLPPPMSEATAKQLEALGIQIHVSSKVSEVLANGVKLSDGKIIPAEMIVWAAGVKAHDRTKEFGLTTNRINQLVVRPTLQTTEDDNIFAIGDCAACAWAGKENAFVPPRAQAAHQQASHVYKQILRRLAGKPLKPFAYQDFGSLVSISEYSTVGNLMGGALGGNLYFQGYLARLMYISLHKMHDLALHGYWKVGLDTLAGLISRRTETHVKLH
jgi:NADH dehydrogenase